MMTVRKAYEWGSEILAKSGIEEAQLDAWYLLEFVTGLSPDDIHEFAHAGMAHLWMPSGIFIANAGEVL